MEVIHLLFQGLAGVHLDWFLICTLAFIVNFVKAHLETLGITLNFYQ